jgi:hypothetical protein
VKLTSTYPAPRIGKTLEKKYIEGAEFEHGAEHQRKHTIDTATLKMEAFPHFFLFFSFSFSFSLSFSLFPIQVGTRKYKNFTETFDLQPFFTKHISFT